MMVTSTKISTQTRAASQLVLMEWVNRIINLCMYSGMKDKHKIESHLQVIYQ